MNEPRNRSDRFGNRRRYRPIEAGQRLLLISWPAAWMANCGTSRRRAHASVCAWPPRAGAVMSCCAGARRRFSARWSGARATRPGVAFHKPISLEELVETVGGEVPAALPTGRRVL